jgi:hypothetical protein
VKRVKGRTAPPRDKGLPTKPTAPSPSRGARDVAPHVLESPERGPRKSDGMPASTGARGDRVKPPLPAVATGPPRGKHAAGNFGDQRPKQEEGARTTERRERYIRMRIQVRDGRLSVVDSHLVDGPLSQTDGFSAGHAYEVTLDDRLLHAGHLPDLGVQRSFVNPSPKAPKEQKGHHLSERSVYEFMARVPAGEVTRDTVGRIAVRLHRVKEGARVAQLGPASLGRQFAREMRPIAELVGLPDSVLPEVIERRGGLTPSA